ncbi:hypothetical protein Hamer_G010940 [Homarus americanus]|uniref:Uncharacterized protein n=1 Tax=Homarus americanus TaxID=6706 RepID=A0A8J5MWD6_HOMAM|nr:hypothetical protein Hamer_G010940 [Homarus americanus]
MGAPAESWDILHCSRDFNRFLGGNCRIYWAPTHSGFLYSLGGFYVVLTASTGPWDPGASTGSFQLYRILGACTGHQGLLWGTGGFYRVFGDFYRVLEALHGSGASTGSWGLLQGSGGFYRVLEASTRFWGFYRSCCLGPWRLPVILLHYHWGYQGLTSSIDLPLLGSVVDGGNEPYQIEKNGSGSRQIPKYKSCKRPTGPGTLHDASTRKILLGIQAVSCTLHATFNQCRGKVFSKELLRYSEEKLLKELRFQEVVKVDRFHKKENVLNHIPNLLLTFGFFEIPTSIKVAWVFLKVKPYIPNPR